MGYETGTYNRHQSSEGNYCGLDIGCAGAQVLTPGVHTERNECSQPGQVQLLYLPSTKVPALTIAAFYL